jgi:penicillin amidase
LLTANNRVYGRGYPYRLSAAFEPPYRAFRIAQLLHARKAYDVAYFARMQMDACSPIDTEISHDIASLEQNAALAHWNGCLNPASTTASLEIQVRNELLEQTTSLATLVAQLRHPNGDLAQRIVIPHDPPQWGKVGEVTVDHPMSSSWYGLLRGATLPGDGDEYTIHLQEPGFAQGFRAVWDVGNWDAGGIVLPSGESGEPGSGHYDDQALPWIRGTLTHLPFTPRAVARATVHTLTLQ